MVRQWDLPSPSNFKRSYGKSLHDTTTANIIVVMVANIHDSKVRATSAVVREPTGPGHTNIRYRFRKLQSLETSKAELFAAAFSSTRRGTHVKGFKGVTTLRPVHTNVCVNHHIVSNFEFSRENRLYAV